MTSLKAENHLLYERVQHLEKRYDELEERTSKKIQELIDENENLAEANRLLLEEKQKPTETTSCVSLQQIPDELLLPGNGIQTKLISCISDAHEFGNLLCVSTLKSQPQIAITGGVDKNIYAHNWDTKESKFCKFEGSAPVLSVSFNPNPEFASYFVASFMDAKHGLFQLKNSLEDRQEDWEIQCVTMFHEHLRQGALRVAWNASGDHFATGSCDKSLHIYRCENLKSRSEKSFKESEASELCVKIKSFYFNGTVEAILFLPTRNEAGVFEEKELLLAAVRDDCYLHYIDMETLEKERINMNQDGIEHSSYTIMDLQLAPSRKYCLAATDKNRLFIFQPQSNFLLRNFYGHKAGAYSQPRAAWHPSEKYIVANSEDSGSLYVWCVASESVVDIVDAHEKIVRDLTVQNDAQGAFLYTVSYDRSMKVWSYDSS
uniref:Uncharacterized protein AlNc14C132G6998 n=1 Tax=Albugo laibachii Nc14 TaxID=890382 RepID=F0WKE6_9STRA|nr:conserved hypothetical protein [Albugo laibachii Nc14]|eukprot:CCA21750.1 conserved hypothetical protein [Albugo laibachii Nc14]